MHAITTKYLGPTDAHGARIRACWHNYEGRRFSVTTFYDDSMSARDNHASAAMRLARMCINGGNEEWHCGEITTGYVFVMRGEGFTQYFDKAKYAGGA